MSHNKPARACYNCKWWEHWPCNYTDSGKLIADAYSVCCWPVPVEWQLPDSITTTRAVMYQSNLVNPFNRRSIMKKYDGQNCPCWEGK